MAIGTPAFYAPWPVFGPKFNQQLGEIRQDTIALQPFVKQSYQDFASDPLGVHTLIGLALGKSKFSRRWRIFYDKDSKEFQVQFNRGTQEVPDWIICLIIRESDCRVIAAGPGGFQSLGGFYPNIGFGDTDGKFYFNVEEGIRSVFTDTIRFEEGNFELSNQGGKAFIEYTGDKFYGITIKEGNSVVGKTDSLEFDAGDFNLSLSGDSILVQTAGGGGTGAGGGGDIEIREDGVEVVTAPFIDFKGDDFDIFNIIGVPFVTLSQDVARISEAFYGLGIKEGNDLITKSKNLGFCRDDFDIKFPQGSINESNISTDDGKATLNLPLTLDNGLSNSNIINADGFGLAVDFYPSVDKLAYTEENLLEIVDNWTLTTWVNFQHINNTYTFLSANQNSGNPNAIELLKVATPNSLQATLRSSSGIQSTKQFNTPTITAKSWQHFAVTKTPGGSNDSWKVYLNGVELLPTSATNTDIIMSDTPRHLTLGGYRINVFKLPIFDGKIGQTAFWSTDLDQTTIQSIYNRRGQADLTRNFENYSDFNTLKHYYLGFLGDGTPEVCLANPLSVGESDNDPLFDNIGKIKFHPDNFYVTQNTDINEVIVNLRGLNFQLTFTHSDETQIIAADEIRFNINDFYLTETSQGFPMLNLRDGGGGMASVVQQGSRDGTAQEWDVRDDLDEMETLEDQIGAGGVLTFLFSSDVHMVILENSSATLTARATINSTETPSATRGVKVLDSPVYLYGITDTVKVFAPIGATVSVAGMRRS